MTLSDLYPHFQVRLWKRNADQRCAICLVTTDSCKAQLPQLRAMTSRNSEFSHRRAFTVLPWKSTPIGNHT